MSKLIPFNIRFVRKSTTDETFLLNLISKKYNDSDLRVKASYKPYFYLVTKSER
jgi:hypothetical protein